MRAARVNEFGPVENIHVEEIPTPSPGAGDLLVRISVAGVNFADVGMSTGAARRTPPPFTPGVEAAGIVEALGEGVTGFGPGERVVYWNPLPSAFAEYAIVPAWRTVRVPAGVTDEVVNQIVTDYYIEQGWDPQTGRPTAETVRALGLTADAVGLV